MTSSPNSPPGPRRPRAAAAIAALALLAASPALAEYRVRSGDVVEFSAAGLPDLRQRATVNMAGEVTLPLVGQLKVAGLPLSEIRERIRAVLPTKVFRRRGEDGREYPVVVAPDEVAVTVAEFRPVYLNGDVAKPGEQVFRPGMTVRQAIALAGGYDLARFRINNPFTDLSELKAEYDALWIEFAKGQSRVGRLRAELDNRAEIDRSQLMATPLGTAVTAQIERGEAEQLASRRADLQKERAFLQQSIKREEGRVAVLNEQQQREKEGTESDAEDLERVNELFRKGTIPITRVVEAKRSILLSSTRLLQTRAQLAQVERELDELRRRLVRLDDQRRLDLVAGLQESSAALATTRARLQAVGEKLAYTGMVRSQLVRGRGAKPGLLIVRSEEAGSTRVVAEEDTELAPGDVVEVSLQADLVAAQGQ